MVNKKSPPKPQSPTLGDNDFEFHGEPGHMARRLHQIAVAVFLELMKEFDLTPIQYAALNAISAYPHYEQRQIARLIAVDRSTINVVTARLATRGLVVREHVGRRIDLSLTPEGEQLLTDSAAARARHSELLLAPLNEVQKRQFLESLLLVVDGNDFASRVPINSSRRKPPEL